MTCHGLFTRSRKKSKTDAWPTRREINRIGRKKKARKAKAVFYGTKNQA